VSINDIAQLHKQHLSWVNSKLNAGFNKKDKVWSGSVAVGSKKFVENVKSELGYRAKARKILGSGLTTV